MSGARRGGVWRRAIPYHDVAGLKLGLAERLAQLRSPRAQLRCGRRPLRPYPHRCPLAAERYQSMDRTGRLDVEREPGSPNPLCRLGLVAAAAMARNLELRHRGPLRRRKRNFEIPARPGVVDARSCGIDTV